MGKVAIKGRLQIDELQDTWEKSREGLAASIGDFQDGVLTAVNGGLETRGNTTSDYYEYVLTHGVTSRIKNPLRLNEQARPVKGIYAVRCVGMEMSGGKPTRKLYSLAMPRIDWEPADTKDEILNVTATWPAPLGGASVYRSAAYNLPDATATRIPVDTATFSNGSMSLDATNESIACAASGFVYASYALQLAASAAGTLRQAFLYKNNTPASPVEIWGRTSIGPQAGVVALSGGGLVSVAAGDLIRFCAFQDSGGVLAVTTTLSRSKLDAHYVAPPSDTTGNVTLFFFGG